MSRLPHPIPYQGSKRKLASAILECTPNRGIQTLYEPFAGSGAITIAAAFRGLAEGFVIADSLDPLSRLWEMMIEAPATTADNYEHLWQGQLEDGRSHFLAVRDDFNQSRDPVKLLYLLARCVKNSPRFNGRGDFNQSADHRRRGMDPHKMRREIAGVSELLRGRVKILSGDFRETMRAATPGDVVYLDPPWEGTSTGTDKRYHASLERAVLIEALCDLNSRDVPWLLSYDGQHGEKTYGAPLPQELQAARVELHAGQSSQATLNGLKALTIESLYVSRQLPVEVELTLPLEPLQLFAVGA